MKTGDLLRKVLKQAHCLDDKNLQPIIRLIDTTMKALAQVNAHNEFMFQKGMFSTKDCNQIAGYSRKSLKTIKDIEKLLDHIRDSENVYKDLP